MTAMGKEIHMKIKVLSTSSVWLLLAVITMPTRARVLEKIVVTAQKREQNAQDVGIAVTAYSGDQIRALGMTNTTEITQQVPGLDMMSFSPNLTAFNMRGVSQNSFTDNLEDHVAVCVEDGYMASMNGIHAQMFDMDRVEVLRGPQGTLFGRNETGGVIQYVTRMKRSSTVTLKYPEVSLVCSAVKGAIGGSISDNARYRISVRSEENDGYIESEPFPEGNPFPNSNGNIGGADGTARN